MSLASAALVKRQKIKYPIFELEIDLSPTIADCIPKDFDH